MNYMSFPGLKKRPNIKAEFIAEAVAEYCGTKVENLKTKGRYRDRVMARKLVFYFLKKHTKMNMRDIAQMFGFRGHATVTHALNSLRDLRSVYPGIDADILAIENKLTA